MQPPQPFNFRNKSDGSDKGLNFVNPRALKKLWLEIYTTLLIPISLAIPFISTRPLTICLDAISSCWVRVLTPRWHWLINGGKPTTRMIFFTPCSRRASAIVRETLPRINESSSKYTVAPCQRESCTIFSLR